VVGQAGPGEFQMPIERRKYKRKKERKKERKRK